MNISPINQNQNLSKKATAQPKFGQIDVKYIRRCYNDLDVLDILSEKFPIGTTIEKTIVKENRRGFFGQFPAPGPAYSHTKAVISGLSQAAEDLIARALDATQLFDEIKKTPIVTNLTKNGILSGLDELGISELQPGKVITTVSEVIE